MRRIKIVGLCLVAVFALSALVAAAAQAVEHPEWAGCVAQTKGEYTESKCATKSKKAHKGTYEFVVGHCVKQKKGEYTEAKCATKSKKAHKGAYERLPASRFTSEGKAGLLKGILIQCENSKEEIKRTGPCSELYNESAVAVLCTSESGTGEASGLDEVKNVKVAFNGCVALEALQCSNTSNPEEVQVNTLDGSLGYIDKGKDEVGVVLEPEAKGGQFAEFGCGAPYPINFAVGAAQPRETSRYGTEQEEAVEPTYAGGGGDGIISPITPVNTLTDEFTQVYSTTESDENIPNKFEGGPLKVLENYWWNPETEKEGRWARASEDIENVDHTAGYDEIKG